jgi:hypothetical protein
MVDARISARLESLGISVTFPHAALECLGALWRCVAYLWRRRRHPARRVRRWLVPPGLPVTV